MGIPSAIHEQNSYPGLTNRLLCRVVDKVFISFEESRTHFHAIAQDDAIAIDPGVVLGGHDL